MGSLLGHIVPGTFFALFALWWGFSIAIKYYHLHQRKKNWKKSKIYYAKTTFPCLCFYSAEKIPLESYVKIVCATIGMLGELITGFTHLYDEKLKRKVWGFGENNTQHITMFLGFALASVFEIVAHYKYSMPDGIEFLANILAFGIEAFLFHFHLHGRNEVDVHVHVLLLYAIIFCLIAAIWEYNRPNQILATYARIIGTLLQGFWFYVIGFILYFPSSDPYWIWPPSHGNILLLTVTFVWAAIIACFVIFLESTIVWYILKRRYSHHTVEVYNEHFIPSSMIPSSDNEDNDDDDDGNEGRFEFEQQQQQQKKQFYNEACA
ncbi:unnamed protein product [Rotaria socialis]|uniref:Transmembrane protein 45B n=1 Tax=Rotaria socialis TaxID=392032 RepID=A0A820JIN2_9BILA|nr:unnamed protein product [Rotaria socialis]CAF4325224.1 unnamed protein product [Rotaria socialis]